MYHVKQRGKDGYAFFREEMIQHSAKRLFVERDIRKALENDEFTVHFQPQVSVNNGELAGVEALIRWQHPENGFVMPGEFIPIAEESSLIVDIDQWMLRRACQMVSSWSEKGVPPVRLGVNFSPLFVERPDFVEYLLGTLAEFNFPCEQFELEITENVILSDLDHTIDKLRTLSDAGIAIAIDDFGTGYSSLSYLQKFPIHTLKIDRSFVQNINVSDDEACIVDAIVSMAHGLKLNIIAEGVETPEQLSYLRRLGCHNVQGFLMGRAVSEAELVARFGESYNNEPLQPVDLMLSEQAS
jgi:EAL domain-containing protein (putative c-di-GMP-specific phosphodiesterase class I)